jgi:hypothetical protein
MAPYGHRWAIGHGCAGPGLVLVSRWRPDDGVPGYNANRAWTYGGVAKI